MEGGELRGLTSDVDRFPGPLRAILAGGASSIAEAHKSLRRGETFDPSEIEFLPVLPDPSKILCVGLNYRDHSAESGFQQPAYPSVFGRFASSLIGHGQPLVRPEVSAALDYEGELAVIIGRTGHRVAERDALDYVAGYSIFNDGSVRDYQHKTTQWTMGKNFDGTGSFGPQLVTPDELPPGAAGLDIKTRLNGETVQASNTADMVFDVPRLIAIISEALTLQPGDVIVSGTPSGVGHARKPPLYMKAGDICEVEIEGVGTLRNGIADEAATGARKGGDLQ
jgi:2-keto-4-pentenoate hydratase/2-oxohepta-3-ene-1,7-dioic acid hydratase in catechol pathway